MVFKKGNQYARGRVSKTVFLKGHTPWNKGNKWSAETRQKMSEARKRFYANGGKHPLLGKKRPDMAGENNPNWRKFGQKHPRWARLKKHPLHKSIREIFKYVEWRKSVFERDNYTCRLCDKSKCFVEADHHPKRFIDIIRDNDIQDIAGAIACSELWDVGNGRTLCRKCHRGTNTWGRRKEVKNKKMR